MSEVTTTDKAERTPFDNEGDLPPKLSELRQKLYRKAKAEPRFRFYALYDRIYRQDVLRAAFGRVARNDGGPGVDGVTIASIETREGGVEDLVRELHEALETKTYRPDAVRRTYIPKPNGKLRPLGIPTIKDRVVQQAALLILEPVFEADFQDSSFGFRPERGAHDALKVLVAQLRAGRSAVYDADLQSYFDSIPHDKLMKCVEVRIADRSVLGLIRAWLNAVVEEPPDDSGTPKRTRPTSGTPQGGVISPLLANVYLHWLDLLFHRPSGPGVFAHATLVRYADDFVIVAKYVGDRITDWVEYWLEERMGLTVNREKTRTLQVTAGRDSLDFLGFRLQWRKDLHGRDRHYLHIEPKPQAQARARAKLRTLTSPRRSLVPIETIVREVNHFMRGWAEYFCFGHPRRAFRRLNAYAAERLWRHLRRRSQRPHKPPPGVTWYRHLHQNLRLMLL